MLKEQLRLHHGDCLEVLKTLPANSVDAVVTDSPYGLSDHKEEEVLACLSAWISREPYTPKGKGFMNKAWDAWVPGPEVWREVLRVLKPGGHMLTFAGTRSWDLMSMAVRLAGFQLRDTINWVYGTGFPKSLDISKAIDKEAGAERELGGLKMSADGTVAHVSTRGKTGWDRPFQNDPNWQGIRESLPATEAAKQWEGWGTGLKPAWEPIILSRKPLQGTVAQNAQQWGVGGLNIDGCRVGTDEVNTSDPYLYKGNNGVAMGAASERLRRNGGGTKHHQGRWPANFIHDGSDEVLELFPIADRQSACSGIGKPYNGLAGGSAFKHKQPKYHDFGDKGSAARYFYCAKASKQDRDEGLRGGKKNTNPCVKPTDLMRYLCRLITPPGGTILDPFAGSGSTGKGAILEAFHFVGIEQDAEYIEIARERIEYAIVKTTNRSKARLESAVPRRQKLLINRQQESFL